jgi:hypothetical protein
MEGMMSITIEPGKSYVDRDGEKWTDPQPVTDEPGYAWSLRDEDGDRYNFTTDGKFWLDGTESASDLVAEWDASAPEKDDAEATAAFHQGFACALGALARNHGEPSVAADIARGYGLTLADFEAAGCEEYDLEPFRDELQPRPAA